MTRMEAPATTQLREPNDSVYPSCNEALTPTFCHYYDAGRKPEHASIRRVENVRPLCDRSSGGFDGPLVALFSEPVHSPREHELHDRERREIHLRRRQRRDGGGPVPD